MPKRVNRGKGEFGVTFNHIFGGAEQLSREWYRSNAAFAATYKPNYSSSYIYGDEYGFAPSSSIQRSRSSPGPIFHEEKEAPLTSHRKISHLMDIPVVRQVKVPITVERIAPAVETQTIPVKKLIQEPSFEWKEEPYLDYEPRQSTRMKEVWVKQMVPEQYTEDIPVWKTRKVKVPCMTTKEITEYEQVQVPTTKVVPAPGYRVDEVIENETVEVEGTQRIEWVPRIVDQWSGEIKGVVGRRPIAHKIGHRVINEDSVIADDYGRVPRDYNPYIQDSRTHQLPSPKFSPREDYSYEQQANFNVNGYAQTPTSTHKISAGMAYDRFGLSLVDSIHGLLVKSVQVGSIAHNCGLKDNDIIRSVNSLDVGGIRDWRLLVGGKSKVTLKVYRKSDQSKTIIELGK